MEELFVNKYQWITMDIFASLKEIFLKGCPLSLEEGKVSQNYIYVNACIVH